jgi:Rubisco LSMT substrate-binding
VHQQTTVPGFQVLETLAEWCDTQLARYSTAVQNDQAELQDDNTSWLRQQVLRALISEKQTIMGLQRQTRDRMQQLKEGCPLETLYV